MAEYIEREVTCEDCIHYDICIFHHTGNENKQCVHFKNKADVVEVVRCKDCKHNVENWQHDELDATDYTDIVCDYFMTDGMYPTDYCSYGAKMDGKGEGE